MSIGADALARAARDRTPNVVDGHVFFDYGLPAGNLVIRAYARGFGGADAKLGEATTDAAGLYTIAYRPPPGPVNLELRTADAKGAELPLTGTNYGVSSHATINLVAPSSLAPLAPEYQRLTADVVKHTGGLAQLAGATENAGRQDLSVLNAATGWDTRLIALAATAVAKSQTTRLPSDVLYALYRAGLPTDPYQLARVGTTAVGHALDAATKAGIVSFNAQQIEATKTAYRDFAVTSLQTAKPSGTVSTYGDMLAKSGLNDAERTTFAQVYVDTGGDSAQLWQQARARNIAPEKVAALQLQGKLAFLTLNNANLTAALQQDIGSTTNLAKLVDHDLHQPDAWKSRLRALANNDDNALGALIPPQYDGPTTADRLDAYSGDLARRVRSSFPTHVVARMIDKGELVSPNGDVPSAVVSTVLRNAAPLGFALGRTPVDAFIAANNAMVFAGVNAADTVAATASVKQLARLFQITPSDESLKTTIELGFTSAHDVVSVPQDRFTALYADRYPSRLEADLVYRKAQQVTTVVFNFFAAAKSLDSSPPVYAVSGPPEQRTAAKQSLIKQYPTMETLFGSLDFCECEECRSVLSPAAYLVDLFQFLDPSATNWQSFLADWKVKHNDWPYPCRTKTEHDQFVKFVPPRQTERTPYDVLLERRPDLPNLPLTCDNTNTVMPYIDIVNEILEYFVVHSALTPQSGHDTGGAISAELIAEPQNIVGEAYDLLRQARFPLALPFDLWLETARRFFDHVGVAFADVLEMFRPFDELSAPASNPNAYGRADVFAESLGLARVEYAIFTDQMILNDWCSLYGYVDPAAALKALASAQTLARSLGLTYRELTSVVETGFVNPSANDVSHAIVLADPLSGCNFARTTLCYANGQPADAIVFLRLNLFVRLWRKLGWTIEETDRALQAFVPKSLLPLTVANIGAAFRSALLGIAHLKALDAALPVGNNARIKLLTLWSNLPANGPSSLYARLFLTRSVLKDDAVFDDAQGAYFSKDAWLKDHLAGVQAAISLSAEEIGSVLADAGLDLGSAKLTMDNVSLLYRYALLAKALGLSVRALIALKSLSGLNPFANIPAAPVTTVHDDVPFSQTLQFVAVARTVRASGFSPEDLDYLLRHRFDPAGKYKQDRGAFLALVRTLAQGLRAIAAAQAMPDDTALTDDLLQQQLALVLPADAVPTFMGMWTGTVQFEAVQADVPVLDKLDAVAFAGTPISVAHDSTTFRQRLTYTGVLVDATALQAAIAPKLAAAPSRLVLAALLGNVRSQIDAFYDKQLKPMLSATDYAAAIKPVPAGLSPEDALRAMLIKRRALLTRLLPYVRDQLTLQFVVQTLAESLGADPALVRALLTDASLAGDRSSPGGTVPLLGAFASTAEASVDATFYASDNGSGVPLPATPTTSTADTNLSPNARSARFEGYFEVPAPGPYRFFAELDKVNAQAELRLDLLPNALIQGTAATDHAMLSAAVDLNAGVLYHFTFDARVLGGGGARLLVQGETIPKDALHQLPLTARSAVDATERAQVLLAKIVQYAQTLPLDERELRHLLLNASDFGELTFTGLPSDANDAGATAPAMLFAQFLRLAAYAQLRGTIAGGGDDLIGVFENAQLVFPVTADAKAQQDAMANGLAQRIADLTRRDLATIQSAVTQLEYSVTSHVVGQTLTVVAPDFRSEQGIAKLWNLLQLLTRLGVPVEAAKGWATPSPGLATAQDLRGTVKAQYSEESWLALAPSIFDKLRQLQRDALVAYCMQKLGFADPGRLFEYFLVDPEMEPVVQTSRLRLAISSVQTFVQRCLLNLEPEVQPSALNAAQWQWMKRYRVWEANRKIFLFPENWLDPAFRDDKTDLYSELEGALLQGDASNDLAEDAFFTYLKKLQEIARLEIVTMHCEQSPLDPASSTLHVIGRTHSVPHKYFYRRYASAMWTPWEAVGAEIDGDHVVAAMWHGRLTLFWLTFLVKNQQDESAAPQEIDFKTPITVPSTPPKKLVHLQLNWSEYFQGKWTARQSSGFSEDGILTDSSFDPSAVFVHAAVATENGAEVVTINLRVNDAYVLNIVGPYPFDFAFRVVSRNSPPQLVLHPELVDPPHDPPYPSYLRARTHYYRTGPAGGLNPLQVTYADRITSKPGVVPHQVTKTILGDAAGTFALTVLGTPVTMGASPDIGTLVSPFFYQDDHNAFYVEPELTESTLEDWTSWGASYTPPNSSFNDPTWWSTVPIYPTVPTYVPVPVNPGDPVFSGTFDAGARFQVQRGNDWVTSANTVLQFGAALVGSGGGLTFQHAAGVTGNAAASAVHNVVGGAGLGVLLQAVGNGLKGLSR